MLICKHYVYIICQQTSETLSVTEEIDSAPLLAAGPGKWYCAASSPGASASGTHGLKPLANGGLCLFMGLSWLYHGFTMALPPSHNTIDRVIYDGIWVYGWDTLLMVNGIWVKLLRVEQFPDTHA